MEDQVPSSKQYVNPGQIPQENNYFTNPEGPRFSNPTEYDAAMKAQAETPYKGSGTPYPPNLNFEEMRRVALQQAIEQVTQQPAAPVPQQQQQPLPPPPPQQQYVPQEPQYTQQEPQVVYVRRNLTFAELVVVFAISCGLVFGIQGTWDFTTNILPRIEIREK